MCSCSFHTSGKVRVEWRQVTLQDRVTQSYARLSNRLITKAPFSFASNSWVRSERSLAEGKVGFTSIDAFSAVLSTEGCVVGLCWAKSKPQGPEGRILAGAHPSRRRAAFPAAPATSGRASPDPHKEPGGARLIHASWEGLARSTQTAPRH